MNIIKRVIILMIIVFASPVYGGILRDYFCSTKLMSFDKYESGQVFDMKNENLSI